MDWRRSDLILPFFSICHRFGFNLVGLPNRKGKRKESWLSVSTNRIVLFATNAHGIEWYWLCTDRWEFISIFCDVNVMYDRFISSCCPSLYQQTLAIRRSSPDETRAKRIIDSQFNRIAANTRPTPTRRKGTKEKRKKVVSVSLSFLILTQQSVLCYIYSEMEPPT